MAATLYNTWSFANGIKILATQKYLSGFYYLIIDIITLTSMNVILRGAVQQFNASKINTKM